jgi:carboxyl-terminal processing protease
MTNKRLHVWLPLLFSIIMVLGMVIGYRLRENTGVKGFFTISTKSPMQEVLDLIKMRYVDEVKVDSISDKAINDLLHQLDPHSVYISSRDIEYVNDDLRGNFSGIGIEFQMFYDTVNVINVLPAGPSEKAGVLVGDKLVRVNDSIAVAGKNLKPDDIRRLLRGQSKTNIKLALLRDGKVVVVTVSRGTISVPSVDAAYMMSPGIGFIHITKFGETTYREFMQALEKLQAQKMEKLVLDLRGNGGGLLSQAVNIADEFLDYNKLIVYTQGKNVPKYEYRCKREGLFEKGGLVLLVDEGSASASEVLGGALQDWDRATIVGRRTFGKGLVQEQFELNDGSALRLTVARYFSPLGRNIQKPYTEGYNKYEEEVLDRFHNGEVLKGDTTKKAGPAYKTPKGRIVYGGGGITPDIYVAFDTASMGKEALKLYIKGTLSNFIYTYYVRHKQQFKQYNSTEELATKYSAGDDEWSALKDFARRDTINLALVKPKDKADIMKRIPALIARQMWRQEGYYEVLNRSDSFVTKALQVIK